MLAASYPRRRKTSVPAAWIALRFRLERGVVAAVSALILDDMEFKDIF
jgi:hypothetical protein